MSGLAAVRGLPPVRWLVTGARGMLGTDLQAVLHGQQLTAASQDALDVTDAAAVYDAVAGHDVVLNAAAYTAVDAAETDEERAYQVNAVAPGLLAAACAKAGAVLVHVSTDYVFAGDATEPYPEDAPVAPRSAYGRTKTAGERAVFETLPDAGYVVRTAWMYGQHGPNFVRTIARLEGERDTIDVVDDQHGQPTWSLDVARGIVALAASAAGAGGTGNRPPSGSYHCVSSGQTTWCGLARAVFAELGADPRRVHPTTTDRFPRPAPRPAYSVLATGRWTAAGLAPPPDWRTALTSALSAWDPRT